MSLWALKMLRRHFPERLSRVETPELLRWLVAENAVLNDLAIELLQSRGGLERSRPRSGSSSSRPHGPISWTASAEMILRSVKTGAGVVHRCGAAGDAAADSARAARAGVPRAARSRQRRTRSARSSGSARRRRNRSAPTWCGGRGACSRSGRTFSPLWVLEFLDSRHEDVREIGWEWLQGDARAREDTAVWQRLLESPYDNIRLRMIAMLEERATGGKRRSSPRRPCVACGPARCSTSIAARA